MISNFWIARRKPHWDRLQLLLERCGHSGVSNLSRAELRDLSLLYRQVAADLSIVRQDASGTNYARYLNQLLGRAHNIIYSGKKTSFKALFRFLLVTWPARLRSLRGYLAISGAVFLLCAAAGALLTLRNPDFILQLLGPGMVDSIEKHEMWTHSIVGVKPLASSAIMTNNLAVAFMTFAAGVTAGLGTLYMLALNGLELGVVGAACGTHKMSLSLWSFVVGHGSLELPAIVIAGAAGLRLGAGMLFPGQLSRKESLRRAAREAVQVELGTIPLLFIAGIVEGFISPSGLHYAWKFALGTALFSALLVWALSGSRRATVSSAALLPDTY
jgi:uncharacterized membrane protein SpoIIM required for sporulation